VFNTENEAINCANFYKTKIVRYLISLTLSSMNITRENFQFVPQVNFSCPISENDLINEWNLSENEIEAVESIIKPMD
jgi:site-specific DNA-methyltransferase (adenine-specific)